MVTSMTDQPGRRDGPDRSGRDKQRQRAPDQGVPGADLLSDLQRWLIRSSAKSMRKEISGQVRRTLGGGRAESADVWETATSEIPPEVGEAPECQWCPICRAARAMRESGPGIGGHLSGAGDAVASAVQDAINALDSVLAKAGGNTQPHERVQPVRPKHPAPSSGQDRPAKGGAHDQASTAALAAPGAPSAAAGEPAATADAPTAAGAPTAAASEPAMGEPIAGEPAVAASAAAAAGWPEERDAWSQVTDQDSAATGTEQPGWPGHGPDDRR